MLPAPVSFFNQQFTASIIYCNLVAF